MAESLDLLEIEPGVRLRLLTGATVEVKHNPRDGMWLFCCYLSHPDNPALLNQKEHAVFAQEIDDFLKEAKAE